MIHELMFENLRPFTQKRLAEINNSLACLPKVFFELIVAVKASDLGWVGDMVSNPMRDSVC